MRFNLTFLKHNFAGFLRTRHFRRLTLLESVAGTGISRDLPSALSQELMAAAAMSDAEALLIRLESHAEALRERYGPNEIEHETPLAWWQHDQPAGVRKYSVHGHKRGLRLGHRRRGDHRQAYLFWRACSRRPSSCT